MSRIQRLERIECLLMQREHQTELEDLKQLAHDARAKIEVALAMYRRGEPISKPTIRHESQHHEVLRRRLSEMRERLERYVELRDTYGIR